MSEVETHVGKATKVQFEDENLSIEEKCMKIISDDAEKLTELSEYYNDDPVDFFRDEMSKEYVIIEDSIWKIESKEYQYEDISIGTKNPDGSISFVAQFYNGGTSLDEVLEDIIKDVTK